VDSKEDGDGTGERRRLFSEVADDSCDGKFFDARHINKTGSPGSSDICLDSHSPRVKGPGSEAVIFTRKYFYRH